MPTITHVQHANNSDNGVSSIAVTVSSTASTNLLVGCVRWSNAVTLSSISDGTTSFTLRSTNTLLDHIALGYLLSANSGKTSITFTFSGSAGFIRAHVWEFHTDSGTWAFDAGDGNNNGTTPTSPASGSITTATPSVAVCHMENNNNSSYSSNQIGGTAAGASIPTEGTGEIYSSWYRIMTSGASVTGTSTLSGGSGVSWSASIDSFTPSGGGASTFVKLVGPAGAAGMRLASPGGLAG